MFSAHHSIAAKPDAGGVRGLSSLVLLGEIMGRLGELEGRYERPDPADYFDVIAGSGTGGLVSGSFIYTAPQLLNMLIGSAHAC